MNGKGHSEARTASTSVMQKHCRSSQLDATVGSAKSRLTYVMMKMNPTRPFSAIVSMIILGTDLLASSVSSAIWTAASDPANEAVAVIDPTKHAAPTLDQPPKLENEPKTSFAGAFSGARTQRGTTMQKKPMTWTTSEKYSRSGSFFAP